MLEERAGWDEEEQALQWELFPVHTPGSGVKSANGSSTRGNSSCPGELSSGISRNSSMERVLGHREGLSRELWRCPGNDWTCSGLGDKVGLAVPGGLFQPK